MKNGYLPDGLLKAMDVLSEATRPYQTAVDALKQNKELFAVFSDPLVSKLSVIDNALEKGFFDTSLAKSVSVLLTPYHEFTGAQEAIKVLGASFQGLMKPNVYSTANAMVESFAKLNRPMSDYQTIQSAIEPLIRATQIVDTTWLKNSSGWHVEKDALSRLNVGNLSGLSSTFSRLCMLEHETSLLKNIPKTLTSAASQIASITDALNRELPVGWKYDNLLSTTKLLEDYCGLATRQHELLQKAIDPDEVSWRLGILDAASKYVDRQVEWYLGFTDAIAYEDITDSEGTLPEAEPTALSLIPTHIGYTRRVDITPAEGLEDSLIVTITEKGKRIAENVLTINRLRLDTGNERIFGLSETVVGGMLNLSTAVCSTQEQLGRIIDVLYFVFYENLKHIKILIGGGDEAKGDQMVRKEHVYQCIFDVKTLRSDLRHDLDHGKPNEVKKKLKSVGDCYKEYCGARPLKPKDFKKLQERVYDKVIELENTLIQLMVSESET